MRPASFLRLADYDYTLTDKFFCHCRYTRCRLHLHFDTPFAA